MADPLLSKIILENKKEEIERYVNNRLPNNPQSLERIYQDLASLSSTINQMISEQKNILIKDQLDLKNKKKKQLKSNQPILNRYSSVKELNSKKKGDYLQRNKQENITKRQQILARSLKDKGIRGITQEIPLGLEIISKQDQKIHKPLQLSRKSEIKSNQPSPILKCIKRFNINKDFYSKTIKDGYVDEQKFFDRQMKQFLDMRTASLKRINSKSQFHDQIKLINSRKFSQVESSLLSKARTSLGYQNLASSLNLLSPERRSAQNKLKQFSNLKSVETQNLLNICSKVLEEKKDKKTKSLMYESKKYEQLREQSQKISKAMGEIKERLQFDGMQLSNNSLEIAQMAKQYTKNKLLDKYTFNYLKAISTRVSNQSVLANRNDLIRNELKFRKVLINK